MRHDTASPAQLGFDNWLAEAEVDNERFRFLKSVQHLPGKWEDALPYYRALIDQHHAAMLEADEDEVFRLKDEAHDLVTKLNGGTSFGLCAPDGYGRRLEEAAACIDGELPKWGQAGSFTMDHEGMAVKIEIAGLFGIGGSFDFWPAFKTYAVDRRKPFISDTGFRSFMGVGYSGLIQGLMPAQFVAHMLADHIDSQLGGKLVKVKPLKAA